MKNKLLRIFLFILLLIPFNIKAEAFEIMSQNVILVNLNNNEIIYEKNKDQIIKVASMQKVMTTITAIEHIDNLDSTVTIDEGMFASLDNDLLTLGLYAGETPTYRDLLYGTMLLSAADAAYTLGVKIAGSEEAFVEMMNETAKKIGLKNSVFKNTTGLDAEGQYSTVEDIYILFKYALNNNTFKEIISKEDYLTSDSQFYFDGPIHNAKHYEMPYFLGGKTGFTEEAGLCLVSTAEYNGISYILVTAGADYNYKNQNYYDQKTIYDYYMTNFNFMDAIKKKDIITTIKTEYDDKVDLLAPRDVSLYISNSISLNDLDIEYVGEEVLERGVKKGDKLGTYYIKYAETVLYEEDIMSPVDVTFKLRTVHKIIIGVILFLILAFVFLRRKRRYRRRRA